MNQYTQHQYLLAIVTTFIKVDVDVTFDFTHSYDMSALIDRGWCGESVSMKSLHEGVLFHGWVLQKTYVKNIHINE